MRSKVTDRSLQQILDAIDRCRSDRSVDLDENGDQERFLTTPCKQNEYHNKSDGILTLRLAKGDFV